MGNVTHTEKNDFTFRMRLYWYKLLIWHCTEFDAPEVMQPGQFIS